LGTDFWRGTLADNFTRERFSVTFYLKRGKEFTVWWSHYEIALGGKWFPLARVSVDKSGYAASKSGAQSPPH
jgi:hypothetical protein